MSTLMYITYEIAAIIVFTSTNNYLTTNEKGIAKVDKWKSNFK